MDNACYGDWPFLFWASSGGLFLTNVRRVALALLVLSGVLGFFSRLGGWNEVALSEPSLDLRNIAAGAKKRPLFGPRKEVGAPPFPPFASNQGKRGLFLPSFPIYIHPPQ